MTDLGRLLRRIAITVAGTVLLAVGVVLLVTPGPGIVVIALALAVFAIEYEWARRRLNKARELARSAAEKTATNQVTKASAVLFGVGAIGLGGILIFTDILPFSGFGTGVCVALAGLITLVTTAYSIRSLRRAQSASQADEREQARCPLLRCSRDARQRGSACARVLVSGPAAGTEQRWDLS